jgi:hypothetical protein
MSQKPDPITYDNGLETNLYSIAEEICSQPPKTPCSIQFIMDHEVNPDFEFNSDLLCDFTMACLRILFGSEITPCDLSEKQFDTLNKYVNSVGYNMILKKEEDDTSYIFKVSFQRYSEKWKTHPLDHLKQYMYH